MVDGKLEQEQDRGAHAARLMNDPMVVSAFEQIRNILISEWASCKDVARREAIWQELNGLLRFRAIFAEAIQTGNLAAKQVEMLRQRNERERDLGLRPRA